MKTIFKYLLICFIFPYVSYSQDFEVSPVLIEFNAEPGKALTKNIFVTNHSSSKQSFSLTLADEVFFEGGKKHYKSAGTTPQSCANWLSIFPTYFDLNAGERQEIQLTIKVPGENYQTTWSTIFVKSAQERGAAAADKSLNTGIVVNPRIAIKVFQSPNSNTNYNAQFAGAKQLDPERVELSIQNTGEKIIKPKISAEIINNSTGETIAVDPMPSFVLPGITRAVPFVLPELKAGDYTAVFIMDYHKNSDLEGYELNISIP